MRKRFERGGDFSLGLELGATPRTLRQVRLERVHAEPLLAIEEEIDFFRQ
jgi:hypothetical protein